MLVLNLAQPLPIKGLIYWPAKLLSASTAIKYTFHFIYIVLPAFFVGLLVAPTSSSYISRDLL